MGLSLRPEVWLGRKPPFNADDPAGAGLWILSSLGTLSSTDEDMIKIEYAEE